MCISVGWKGTCSAHLLYCFLTLTLEVNKGLLFFLGLSIQDVVDARKRRIMLTNEQFVDCNKNLRCCIIGLPRYPWGFCPHLAKNKGRKVPTLYNSVLSEVCTAVTRVAKHLSQCFDWSLASFDQNRQMLNRQNRCKTGRCSASSLSQSPDLFQKTSYAYGSVSITTDNGVLPSRVLVNFFLSSLSLSL